MPDSTKCSSRTSRPTWSRRTWSQESRRLEGASLVIRSMTGFASLTHEDTRATIGVTLRSVNHRYLDLQLRLPSSFAELDGRMRAVIQKRLSRGRVELSVSVQPRTPSVPS